MLIPSPLLRTSVCVSASTRMEPLLRSCSSRDSINAGPITNGDRRSFSWIVSWVRSRRCRCGSLRRIMVWWTLDPPTLQDRRWATGARPVLCLTPWHWNELRMEFLLAGRSSSERFSSCSKKTGIFVEPPANWEGSWKDLLFKRSWIGRTSAFL